MTQHLIFILPYTPTAWDAERFGFNFLLQKGVRLEVFDMSNIICTRANQGQNFLTEPYITKIKSIDDLEVKLKQVAHSALFIDKINGLNGFKWQSRRIFYLFKKYNIKYYLVEIGSLPLLTNLTAKNFLNKLKKIFQIKKLIAYGRWKLSKIIVDWETKYLDLYQLPEKIFVGRTDFLSSYLKKYQFKSQDVIPIHSFDYDRYLQYLRQHREEEYSAEKTCVFLDQALINHSDFAAMSFSPVTAEKYIPSISQFFQKVEQETGLEVVIAASPRATDSYLQKMFGQRKVVKGKTLELVAKSSLVLMHTSTAVSFPILFNKPIFILKTDEMRHAYGYANFIDHMAASLGLKPLEIDNTIEMEKIHLREYQQMPRNFDNYKYKYIQTQGLTDKTTWEFVLDYLNS